MQMSFRSLELAQRLMRQIVSKCRIEYIFNAQNVINLDTHLFYPLPASKFNNISQKIP